MHRCFWINEELESKLDKLSRNNSCSKSKIINDALKKYFEKYEIKELINKGSELNNGCKENNSRGNKAIS